MHLYIGLLYEMLLFRLTRSAFCFLLYHYKSATTSFSYPVSTWVFSIRPVSIISTEMSADINYAQTGNVLPCGAGLAGIINARLLSQHVLRLSTAMYGHGPLQAN